MNSIDLFAFMQQTVTMQAQLNAYERVIWKVVGGECICQEPKEARKTFRCPVHEN